MIFKYIKVNFQKVLKYYVKIKNCKSRVFFFSLIVLRINQSQPPVKIGKEGEGAVP